MRRCSTISDASMRKGWRLEQLKKSWMRCSSSPNRFHLVHPLPLLVSYLPNHSVLVVNKPPLGILKSPQVQALSEYERKEILDYPSVYCIGADSKKNAALPDNPTNNYGYDDERGDYLVVNHDHLAYRYEIIDTLGKGSFGQVLHCRDHCTGESVAVKIIRNKKRFHHQAIVEIKILDNLRKWVSNPPSSIIKTHNLFCLRTRMRSIMSLR